MRARVTFASMMGLVLLVAAGLGAFRSAWALWASALFTLAVLSTLAAAIAAVADRPPARGAWAGSAIACGGRPSSLWPRSARPGPRPC